MTFWEALILCPFYAAVAAWVYPWMQAGFEAFTDHKAADIAALFIALFVATLAVWGVSNIGSTPETGGDWGLYDEIVEPPFK